MSTAVKIALIGAGSSQFSLGMVRDLCLAKSLYGSLVSFMDIDAERLEMVHRLAVRYAEELGVDLRFEATLEREQALKDADFIVNTALVGGHDWNEAWRQETEALGYYRGLPIQTNFHQYGLMLSLAHDVERICPQAWLLQLANPVFEGCTLATRETGAKIIGLCHSHLDYRKISDIIGVSSDDVRAEAAGVNKTMYLYQLRKGGETLYPKIDEWIETGAAEYWRAFRGGTALLTRAAVNQYRRMGLMPIGDACRTQNEWYYHTDLATKREWYGPNGGLDSEIGWAGYMKRLQANVDKTQQVALDKNARVTELIPPVPTTELPVPIMDAIANDQPGIFQVNVPNKGCIEGIAGDVVVEANAQIDRGGVRLLHVGRLPEKVMLMALLPRILRCEQELAAYTLRDRGMLEYLVLQDHRTRSLEHAQQVVQRLLDVPWNEDLARHFGKERRHAPLAPYDLSAPAQ
jgi:alpha-galactosidase